MQINYDIEVKEHTVTVDPQYFNAAIALVFLPTAFVLMGPVAVRSSPNIRTMVTMRPDSVSGTLRMHNCLKMQLQSFRYAVERLCAPVLA